MGVRERFRSLSRGVAEIDSERLVKRFAPLGLTPIAGTPARTRTTICGEVERISLVPRQGASAMEIAINDGTGEATVVFSGRAAVRGIGHGRCIVIEGVAHEDRGRLVFLNPAYTLLPPPEH
jgi:hypothetical protein